MFSTVTEEVSRLRTAERPPRCSQERGRATPKMPGLSESLWGFITVLTFLSFMGTGAFVKEPDWLIQTKKPRILVCGTLTHWVVGIISAFVIVKGCGWDNMMGEQRAWASSMILIVSARRLAIC